MICECKIQNPTFWGICTTQNSDLNYLENSQKNLENQKTINRNIPFNSSLFHSEWPYLLFKFDLATISLRRKGLEMLHQASCLVLQLHPYVQGSINSLILGMVIPPFFFGNPYKWHPTIINRKSF